MIETELNLYGGSKDVYVVVQRVVSSQPELNQQRIIAVGTSLEHLRNEIERQFFAQHCLFHFAYTDAQLNRMLQRLGDPVWLYALYRLSGEGVFLHQVGELNELVGIYLTETASVIG